MLRNLALAVAASLVTACEYTPDKEALARAAADQKALQTQAAEKAAKRKADDDAESRFQDEVKTLSDDELIDRVQNLGASCNETACYQRALDHAQYIRSIAGHRPARVIRKVKKGIASLEGVITALAQRDGAIATFGAHIHACCDMPAFMYSRSTKVQCREWGLNKCVDGED